MDLCYHMIIRETKWRRRFFLFLFANIFAFCFFFVQTFIPSGPRFRVPLSESYLVQGRCLQWWKVIEGERRQRRGDRRGRREKWRDDNFVVQILLLFVFLFFYMEQWQRRWGILRIRFRSAHVRFWVRVFRQGEMRENKHRSVSCCPTVLLFCCIFFVVFFVCFQLVAIRTLMSSPLLLVPPLLFPSSPTSPSPRSLQTPSKFQSDFALDITARSFALADIHSAMMKRCAHRDPPPTAVTSMFLPVDRFLSVQWHFCLFTS